MLRVLVALVAILLIPATASASYDGSNGTPEALTIDQRLSRT